MGRRTKAAKSRDAQTVTCNLQAGRESASSDAASPAWDNQHDTNSYCLSPCVWQVRSGVNSSGTCSKDSRPSTATVAGTMITQQSADYHVNQQRQHQRQGLQQATTQEVADMSSQRASRMESNHAGRLHAARHQTPEVCTRPGSSTSGLGINSLEQQRLPVRPSNSHPFSAYLQSMPSSARRPRSPGPRPRSPLSGLSRMTARVANSSGPARVTSSSGYDQARPTTANRTAMASNIYMQHHKSSRGRSRLMHHHQRHMRQQNCSIKIEVSYSALPADQPPAVQTSCGPSHTSSSDNMSTVSQIDTALDNMHDSVPRVAAYADQPITGLAGGSAVDYAEPGLGMTLTEYMAKMHTTPVACNSVSGLGDESEDDIQQAYSRHEAQQVAVPANTTAAWGTVGSQAMQPQTCPSQLQYSSSRCQVAERPVTAVHRVLSQWAFGNTDSWDSEHRQRCHLDLCHSSASSLSEIDEAPWVPSVSNSLSEADCYPDIDSVSDLQQEDPHADEVEIALPAAHSGQLKVQAAVGIGQAVGVNTPESTVSDPRACPQLATTLRSSCNKSGLRPVTASELMHHDEYCTPGLAGVKPNSRHPTASSHFASSMSRAAAEQRSFTDLDSSTEGFVKEASLGHLSAALFTPTTDSTTSRRDGFSGRSSWQQQHGEFTGPGSHVSVLDATEPRTGRQHAVRRPGAAQPCAALLAWGPPAAGSDPGATQHAGVTAAKAAVGCRPPTRGAGRTVRNETAQRLFTMREGSPSTRQPEATSVGLQETSVLQVTEGADATDDSAVVLHEVQPVGRLETMQRPCSRHKQPSESLHLFDFRGSQ